MTMRTYGLEAGFENIELNTLRKGHDGKQYLVYAGYLSIFDGYIVENIKIDTLGFVGYGKDTKFLNTEYPYIVMISDLNDIYIFDIENKRFDFVETKIEITDSFNLFNYGKEAYLFNRNKELARLNIKDRTFYRDSTFWRT